MRYVTRTSVASAMGAVVLAAVAAAAGAWVYAKYGSETKSQPLPTETAADKMQKRYDRFLADLESKEKASSEARSKDLSEQSAKRKKEFEDELAEWRRHENDTASERQRQFDGIREDVKLAASAATKCAAEAKSCIAEAKNAVIDLRARLSAKDKALAESALVLLDKVEKAARDGFVTFNEKVTPVIGRVEKDSVLVEQDSKTFRDNDRLWQAEWKKYQESVSPPTPPVRQMPARVGVVPVY